MTRDAFQAGINALANASRTPVRKEDLTGILATGDGPGHLVRALFEDCSLETLDRMAAAAGLSARRMRTAYSFARKKHGAKNPELEPEDTGF